MITQQLTYLGYAAGWSLIRKMPERAAYRLFDRLADQLWRRNAGGVRQLERNLSRVTGLPLEAPELRELSRAGMRSYMRYWCDAFRLPDWDRAAAQASFKIAHPERLADPVKAGRGAICVLPHMGNWDHAGVWASLEITPLLTVAEKLEPEQLYQAFVSYRESLGMDILGLGDEGVFEALAQRLRDGGLVCLLGDRDLTARGVDVTFFGERTRFPAGPAALAVDTGAALLPVVLYRVGAGNGGAVTPEVPVPATGTREEKISVMTQAVAQAFEAAIAEHPEDWHMLQKLWLADLDQDRLAAADRAGGRS